MKLLHTLALLLLICINCSISQGTYRSDTKPSDIHNNERLGSSETLYQHSSSSEVQRCPHGCRCSASPRLSMRHHWHRLLAQYRMRRLVYGGHSGAGLGYRLQQQRSHHSHNGREMTCFGLTDMPDSMPSDISKVIFYGDSKGQQQPSEELSDSAVPYSSEDVSGYHQLTSISQSAFIGSDAVKDLAIENNRIKILHPGEFSMTTSLLKLHLKNNRLKVLSVHAFRGLANLEELDLRKNHIKRISKSTFSPLISLQKLNLAENRIQTLHSKLFSPLSKLLELDLSFNHIRDMGKDTFFGTSSLKHLVLGNNDIRQIRPEWFSNMKSLTKLDLRGNQITVLPDGVFENVPLLRSLILESNQLSIIRRGSFGKMQNLKSLKLKSNNISEIESYSFAGLEALEELNLEYNDIDSVNNKTLYGLSSLKRLKMSRNKLLGFTNDDVLPILKAEKIDFSHNQIKTVKRRSFFGFLNLQSVRLDHNNIRVIEDEAFTVSLVNTFSKLTWLYLNSNGISHIKGDTFYGLPYLKFLNLGQNEIERIEIDGGLSKLPRLNTFVIRDNLLPSIDVATFKHNRVLRHLNIANNRIKKLAARSFLGLDKIEDINLHGNEIEDIDHDAFINTPNLISLRLRKNQLRYFDMTALKPTKILKYLDLSKNKLTDMRIVQPELRNLFFFALNDNNLERLNENVTTAMAKKGHLHVYDNPWSCDCDLRWLRRAEEEHDVVLADTHGIMCKTPAHLTGEKLMSLKEWDLSCGGGSDGRYHGYQAEQASSSSNHDSPGCSFMPHAKEDNTRKHIKSMKKETESWLATFHQPHSDTPCSGVRLSSRWIITPSHCLKSSHPGSHVQLQLGSSSEGRLYNTSISEIIHYTGPMEISMVEVGKVKEGSKQHSYPCLLSEKGTEELVENSVTGVFTTRVTDASRKSRAKLRTFLVPSLKAGNCASERVCFRLNSQKFIARRFESIGMPVFMKVGRSRWALAGFSANVNDKAQVMIEPIHDAIQWINQTLE